MNQDPVAVAIRLAGALEAAWNKAEADAFGAQFGTFADFVNSQAEHHRGRRAIVWGHAMLFDTMFKGSSVSYTVKAARLLAPNLLSAQIAAILTVPQGPMAGENHATITIVARQKGDEWLIEVFHNTIAPEDGH